MLCKLWEFIDKAILGSFFMASRIKWYNGKAKGHSLSYDLNSGIKISASAFDFSNVQSFWHQTKLQDHFSFSWDIKILKTKLN